jgi:hypothetical protein
MEDGMDLYQLMDLVLESTDASYARIKAAMREIDRERQSLWSDDEVTDGEAS